MHPIISNISKFFHPTLSKDPCKNVACAPGEICHAGLCKCGNSNCTNEQVCTDAVCTSGISKWPITKSKSIVFVGKNYYIHTEYFISHVSLCSLLQACTNDGGLKGNGTVHGTCNRGSKCMANGDCHGMGCYVFNANCSRTAAGIRNEILSLTFTVI